MTQQDLGRLMKVNLRDVWSGEASDFTPWLAEKENLDLLGDTLGMELELVSQEKEVGPYSADIFCKNTADDSWVVIENQLEKTDHSHLGQVLTYAAGLSAVTIVWIAQRFIDEHRRTIDWLNEISDNNAQFFGLEIEVWRIGDSQPAPKLNIIAKPNNWSDGPVVTLPNPTPNRRTQLEFWNGFREYTLDRETPIKPSRPQPRYVMDIGLGRTGFRLSAIASFWNSAEETYDSHELAACLKIDAKDHAKTYFGMLYKEKAAIEAEIGGPLIWQNPGNSQTCTIFVRKTTDLKDETSRPKQYAWLLENLEMMYRAFVERVKNLQVVVKNYSAE